jgi:hypothetical protein
MKDVAGQNNIAYREFFNFYKATFEQYVAASQHQLHLDRLPAKCVSWPGRLQNNKGTDATEIAKNIATEKKVFFLLLANEDEVLRTETSFLARETNFEVLEKLYRRADFVASIGEECLPDTVNFTPNLLDGTVAEHQITAGLVGLAVAEQMSTIARSAGDREHARDIRREAENHLRVGSRDLTEVVNDDMKENQALAWNRRIFAQSRWEHSAYLATRALSQLRSRGN